MKLRMVCTALAALMVAMVAVASPAQAREAKLSPSADTFHVTDKAMVHGPTAAEDPSPSGIAMFSRSTKTSDSVADAIYDFFCIYHGLDVCSSGDTDNDGWDDADVDEESETPPDTEPDHPDECPDEPAVVNPDCPESGNEP